VITLVLGGVRSGKSEVAERLAGPGPGTYLATGLVSPGDDDFAERVARHRARRPAAWVTVEEPRAVPAVLARLHGPVLLDALGTWVANDLRPDLDALVAALVSRRGDTVVVSEEVGLGVHPVSEVGRLFADRLGEANRRVAEVADRCLLVVAGRVIDLPAGPGVAAGGAAAAPAGTAAGDISGETLLPVDAAGGGGGGGFRQAVTFLTPLGPAAAPTPAALDWFPVVGALIGLVLGGVWWAAEGPLGPLPAAALVVAADLAVTGALHFDGLLDSADGLLPHLRSQRRLAVMADPHAGAFAVAVGAGALLLRTAALAGFGAVRPWLLVVLWSLSRTAMAVTALTGRYARSHGLASAFLAGPQPPAGPSVAAPAAPAGPALGQPPGREAAAAGPGWLVPAGVGAVVSLGLAVVADPRSVVAVVAAALTAAGVAWLARRRIGGFTGDTLGAAGVLSETVGLLTALAVLHR
jgi:adenosyl cobinamide kinase/adenosyl cobinamide phosphate guanylyltransferase/cobalamin synthase